MKFIKKLKAIFSISPPEPDFIHPYFGPIKIEDGWLIVLGFTNFEPLDLNIEIMINVGNSTLTDKHVDFYKRFILNYKQELERALNAIINDIEQGTREKMNYCFTNNSRFCALTIPENGDIYNNWEISFMDINDKHFHIYSVELSNNEIINIRMDG